MLHASANDNKSNENQLSKLSKCEAQSFNCQKKILSRPAMNHQTITKVSSWLVQSVHSIYPADFLKKNPMQINLGNNKLK